MSITIKENEDYGIVFRDKTGTIKQIGLKPSQIELLKMFLASISDEKTPLVVLPKEFDLVLKNEVNGEHNKK